MNKYNNRSNISGSIIHKARIKNKLSFENLSDKLALMNITLYPNDLFLIENERRILKDFELIGICKILSINTKQVFDEL